MKRGPLLLALFLAACRGNMGTGLPFTLQPTHLLTLSGSGSELSPTFQATGLSLDFTYTFACASAASAGHFVISFYGAAAANPTPPVVPVDVGGATGAATTTLWLNGAGGPFHFAVDSACDWTVTVSGTR